MNIHKHVFAYALGAIFFAIALGISLHLAGQILSPWNYLSYVGYVVLVVLGLKGWRDKEKGGVLSYGQAMGYSTWMAVYYSLLIAVWTFVFFQYIAHDELVRAQSEQMAKNLAEAKEKYHLSDEMIEQQREFGKKFMRPGFLVGAAFVMNMLFLTIGNLIISAFMKKDKPVAAFENPVPPPAQ